MSFNFTIATTGAAAAVEEVFNAVWQIAQDKSTLTDARTNTAIAYATNAPQMTGTQAAAALNALHASAQIGGEDRTTINL